MAKISTIEIAAKQRHLYLLRKVTDNKTLTRAELVELKKFERQAAGRITAKTRMISKVRPKKKKPKAAATAGRVGKKAKKKRKARPPVDEAEVRRLGLECENLAEADAAVRTRSSLSEIFRKHPQLRQAWDRGRFMRNLRDLARTGASVPEAAKKLGFANGRVLQAMLDDDLEIDDLWKQTQLEICIEIKSAIIEAAKEGKPDAVRAVESFLLDDKERAGSDLSHITILQLTELTGRTRQTIHNWFTKFGMPRNEDRTIDLSIFLAWFEEFLLKKASIGKESAVVLDPLKAMKAEKLDLEIKKHRGELLDRKEVMGGLLARHQILLSWASHRVDELSRLCQGQKPERIAQLIKEAVIELRRSLCQVPDELRLPEDVAKLFKKTLESL